MLRPHFGTFCSQSIRNTVPPKNDGPTDRGPEFSKGQKWLEFGILSTYRVEKQPPEGGNLSINQFEDMFGSPMKTGHGIAVSLMFVGLVFNVSGPGSIRTQNMAFLHRKFWIGKFL